MFPIASILGSVAFLLLGHGLLNTLLTLRGLDEGYSAGMIGIMMSGYFSGYLLGTWIATPLIRRVGHIRTFAFYAALAAIVALVHALIVDPWVWTALRVLYGIAIVTLYMVIESWLNAKASNEKRGQVFAIYMAVNLGALALAQQLLGLASPAAFTLFALSAILICCALMPITLTHQTQPSIPETPPTNLRELARIAPLPLLASAISGLSLAGFWGLAPLYATQNGFDPEGVGIFMSLSILGGAVLQWPIGRLSDRFDRRKVMMHTVFITIVLSLLMSTLTAGTPLLVVAFFWGGTAFSLYSLAVAQMADQLKPEELLSASSGLLLANGFGSSFGPAIVGGLMSLIGAAALPLYYAATLSLLLVYALLRSRKVIDLLSHPLARFTPVMRTSPVVLDMLDHIVEDEENEGEGEGEGEGEQKEAISAEDEAPSAEPDDNPPNPTEPPRDPL